MPDLSPKLNRQMATVITHGLSAALVAEEIISPAGTANSELLP